MPYRSRANLTAQKTENGTATLLDAKSIASGLLFLSGAAALVYQVLWAKQLSLVVGVDIHAITIAISAFFAGLGFGGLLIGRLADIITQPVRFYAGLELGVAASGFAATWTLARIAPLFAVLEDQQFWLAWLMLFAIVAIPPFLMGGTLPVLVRALAPRDFEIGTITGRLYAANTTGAIIGALGATFVLIPGVGLQGAAIVAAIANIAAALGALGLQRHRSPAVSVQPVQSCSERLGGHLALVLYAVAGGIALGYEVVWSQAIVQFLSTRVFAFSIVLATYLIGLASGAFLFARYADRVRNPWNAFALLIAGAGLVGLAAISSLGSWVAVPQTALEAVVLDWTGNGLAGMSARFAVAAVWVVLLPTICLGAAFPVAMRLVAQENRIGRDVGAAIGLNTIGGIAGVAVTGLMLVPGLGLIRSMATLAFAAVVLGLVAMVAGGRRLYSTGWRPAAGAMAAIAVATVGLAIATPASQLGNLLAQSRRGSLVTYEESWGGTVAVIEQTGGSKSVRRLYIQGVSNSGDAMPSLRYMRLQALLPLILHSGEPRSALVIGLGTGITAGAVLRYPDLEKRVVAELLPAVLRAAPSFRGNYDAPSAGGLDIRLRDGRRELLRSREQYDVITLEPPPPAAAGVVNLYSVDFYRLARERLRPGGIMAQWLPLSTQNDEDTRSLVRSFLDVFPYASLWTTDIHEMLLIGSDAPLRLDVSKISHRFNQPDVASALTEVGVASPATLLATWVTDRAGLERYAGAAPAVTDDRPRIEYSGWSRPGEFQRVLPELLALRTQPPLENADETFRASVAIENERLLAFYAAALNAQRGERELWARNITRVMREDGQNPYYRWFTGGAH
jgi:spermidine synthase